MDGQAPTVETPIGKTGETIGLSRIRSLGSRKWSAMGWRMQALIWLFEYLILWYGGIVMLHMLKIQKESIRIPSPYIINKHPRFLRLLDRFLIRLPLLVISHLHLRAFLQLHLPIAIMHGVTSIFTWLPVCTWLWLWLGGFGVSWLGDRGVIVAGVCWVLARSAPGLFLLLFLVFLQWGSMIWRKSFSGFLGTFKEGFSTVTS